MERSSAPATSTLATRLRPRMSPRAQLVAAALMWLIGSAILLVRGVGYIVGHSWIAAVLAVGLVLGALKARYVLERTAAKAVRRIREQGHAFVLAFFSWKAWLFITLMMGSGMALRRIVATTSDVGAAVMGVVYVGVGTALLLGDRVYWHAAFRRPLDRKKRYEL